eukprot:Seg2406.3 transcript_id=Seg2406.3/GoldUCD/mRNA.D3Y31 product="Guanine nucleotide exchange C9orf72-like" protein_id=Seg2406.3/GoldUCD/D3Y31
MECMMDSFSPQSIPRGSVESSLLSGIMLSYWDNIMGPRVKMVWHGNEKIKMSREIISFVSSHTLNGELCRVREEGNTDSKFYVLSDRGYIFYASIFLGMSKAGQTVFSLAFIMALQDMNRYLELQYFLNKQIGMLVMKYRVLQEKDLPNAVPEFSFHLKRFVAAAETLEGNKIPIAHISVAETAFSNSEWVLSANLNDSKFLMRAITSHLQTGGCTVVIGLKRNLVNIVINTLGIFMKPNERACSRYANDKSDYERDLFLQGLVRPSSGNTMQSKDVILSNLPTTYIDIDTREVRQTSEIHEHQSTRLEFLKLELRQLLEGKEMPIFPTKGLFHDVEDIAIMVQHFVSEIAILPSRQSVLERYIEDFLHLLSQKAASLISYVEARSGRGDDPLSQGDIRRMRHDLSLLSEADFRIVLAQAEKSRPGFVSFLFGDSARYQATNQAIRSAFVELI